MVFIDAGELPVKEPRPGWLGRFFHSEHMTFAHYEIAPGSDVHLHDHPHEEVWNIIEGELEMTVDGTTQVVAAGQVAVVPAGVPHSARAIGPCRAIVVDLGVREAVGDARI